MNSDKVRASPAKIAYYVQHISEKEHDERKIVFVIVSQFDKRDIREFAKKYKDCCTADNVRHIANLIYSIPYKDLKRAIDSLLKSDVYYR